MNKVFHIPGITIPFRQSIISQGITSDANFLYLKAREIIEKNAHKSYLKVLDLGTGCGIILLMLAKDFSHLQLTGVEILPDLVKLATENCRNFIEFVGLRSFDIKIGDFCDLDAILLREKYDLIVSNPPYYKKENGKFSKNYEKAIARFEIKSSLQCLLNSVKNFLSKNGSSLIMYPFIRKNEVEEACLEIGLSIRSYVFTGCEILGFHNDYDKINNKTRVIFEIVHA